MGCLSIKDGNHVGLHDLLQGGEYLALLAQQQAARSVFHGQQCHALPFFRRFTLGHHVVEIGQIGPGQRL